MQVQIREPLKLAREILSFLDLKLILQLRTITILLSLLSLLDMLAIFLLYRVISSTSNSNQPLKSLIGDSGFQVNSNVLLLIILVLFTAKTFFSAKFTKKMYKKLANSDQEIFEKIVSSFLNAPLKSMDALTETRAISIALYASEMISLRFIGSLLIVISEGLLITALFATSLIIDPLTSIVVIICLTSAAVFLDLFIKKRANFLSDTYNSALSVNLKNLTESINSLRDFKLRRVVSPIVREAVKERTNITRSRSELTYLSQLPKFVLEITLIVAASVVGIVKMIQGSSSEAYASIALLVALGFRLLPSIARLQTSLVDLRSTFPLVHETLSAIEEIERDQEAETKKIKVLSESGVQSNVRDGLIVSNITFQYSKSSVTTIQDLSFETNKTGLVCLVGPSGAGKSSLVDLISGLRVPSEGNIFWNRTSIFGFLNDWHSQIALVPQFPRMYDGTVASNIALNFGDQPIDQEKLFSAIQKSQLSKWLETLPEGSQTLLNRSGNSISGGQRQRIAIARAIYANPKVMILDEATSALDVITEGEIIETISALRHEMLVFAVSHRLALVTSADLVLYLDQGKLVSAGNYEKICQDIPGFRIDSKLI